jgi:hypothetical protein
MRALRARSAQGHAIVKVEVEVVRLSEALIEDGFLQAWDADDKGALELALAQMVAAYCVSMLGPPRDA